MRVAIAQAISTKVADSLLQVVYNIIARRQDNVFAVESALESGRRAEWGLSTRSSNAE